MKKFLVALTAVIAACICSNVEAKDYFVTSSYTENYRGTGVGLKQTTYIDSDKIARYAAIDGKGGLLLVGIIEVLDWDTATKYHPKQQVFRKNYYFFRSRNGRPHSLFDDVMIRYTMAHDIPGDVVIGLKGDGLRCLVPRWAKQGYDVFRDELVAAADGSQSDLYLLKIYNDTQEILTE